MNGTPESNQARYTHIDDGVSPVMIPHDDAGERYINGQSPSGKVHSAVRRGPDGGQLVAECAGARGVKPTLIETDEEINCKQCAGMRSRKA